MTGNFVVTSFCIENVHSKGEKMTDLKLSDALKEVKKYLESQQPAEQPAK